MEIKRNELYDLTISSAGRKGTLFLWSRAYQIVVSNDDEQATIMDNIHIRYEKKFSYFILEPFFLFSGEENLCLYKKIIQFIHFRCIINEIVLLSYAVLVCKSYIHIT